MVVESGDQHPSGGGDGLGWVRFVMQDERVALYIRCHRNSPRQGPCHCPALSFWHEITAVASASLYSFLPSHHYHSRLPHFTSFILRQPLRSYTNRHPYMDRFSCCTVNATWSSVFSFIERPESHCLLDHLLLLSHTYSRPNQTDSRQQTASRTQPVIIVMISTVSRLDQIYNTCDAAQQATPDKNRPLFLTSQPPPRGCTKRRLSAQT